MKIQVGGLSEGVHKYHFDVQAPEVGLGEEFSEVHADVVLDKVKTLASNSRGILGSFYMRDLAVGINGWVNVGAHGSQVQTVNWETPQLHYLGSGQP